MTTPAPPADVLAGVKAVLGDAAPPVVITPTIGTGRWNHAQHTIEIDPKVLAWPPECQRFIGAHEAAHVGQKPIPPWWVVNAMTAVVALYSLIIMAGAARYGLHQALAELAIEATMCLGAVFFIVIDLLLYTSRRREYQADQLATAAVGTVGINQWRRISEQQHSTATRAMLAMNAFTGLRTHPTWRRRIAAANRPVRPH